MHKRAKRKRWMELDAQTMKKCNCFEISSFENAASQNMLQMILIWQGVANFVFCLLCCRIFVVVSSMDGQSCFLKHVGENCFRRCLSMETKLAWTMSRNYYQAEIAAVSSTSRAQIRYLCNDQEVLIEDRYNFCYCKVCVSPSNWVL